MHRLSVMLKFGQNNLVEMHYSYGVCPIPDYAGSCHSSRARLKIDILGARSRTPHNVRASDLSRAGYSM